MASSRCAVMASLLKASLPSRHPYIPDDLIFSILAQLPAKSIVRFRCVSKAWLAMTSSQTFVDAHLGFSKASPTKLIVRGERFQRQRGKKTPLCMEFYKYKGGGVAELVHSQDTIPGEFSSRAPPLHCDGLILTFTQDQEMMVCNPATREFLALPKGTNGGVGDQLVGFGRDPCSKKYKVARFFYQRKLDTSQHECKFEVLTLGTNVWSRTVDPPCSIHDLAPAHVVVQGFIYWRPLHQQPSFKFFIRFSLADETFSKVPYPPCEAAPVAFLELEDDELSCACVAQPSEVMEIWTCTNTTDMPTWTQRCTFHLPQENVVPGSGGGSLGRHGISCYKKNLSFTYGDGCYWYNIGTEVMEKVRFVAFKDICYYHPEKGRFQEYLGEEVVFRNVNNYAESLVQISGQVVTPKATGCWRKRKILSWVGLTTAAAELCNITFEALLLAGLLVMVNSCYI